MPTTCTRASLLTGGACFTEPNFTSRQQEALFVYMLAKIVDSAASTNYSSDASGTWSGANSLTCGMTKDQLQAGMLAVLNLSLANGTFLLFSLETTAATKAVAAEAIKCFELYSDEQLQKMKVFLFCALFGAIGS